MDMQRRNVLLGAVAATVGLPRLSRAANAPIVLELFTSQGCSSCPPADALLGTLARQPGVIALAWHVDYWNSLSWRDPFASAEATNRQRLYAQRISTFVYTPALVINGAIMEVGSDAANIGHAMQQTAALPVPMTLHRDGETVLAMVPDAPIGTTILRVKYQPQADTGVRGGENAGRRLTEYRIARDPALAVVHARPISLGEVTDPGLGVVALLQDKDGKLIGAADLPPA